MAIPFTQFLRPDGRKRDVTITRGDEVESRAQLIIAAGYRFECEQIGDSQVSLTITNDDGDQAIEVCLNGPEVPLAVDRMIEGFKI